MIVQFVGRAAGIWFVLAMLSPLAVAAAVQHQTMDTSPALQVFAGEPARIARRAGTSPVVPPRSGTAMNRLHAASPGGRWEVLWDQDTGVPLRVYGSGLPATNAVYSEHAAAHHAQRLLAEYIDLLAPGAAPSDFRLISNVEHNGVRSVGFVQTVNGMEVISGQLSFRFKHDRMIAMASEALPFAVGKVPPVARSKASIEAAALDWIRRSVDLSARQSGPVSEVLVLPIVRKGAPADAVSFHAVKSVEVTTQDPVGRWMVYVDAGTGEPVARRQNVMFGSATALFRVPMRWPGGVLDDKPAALATFTVDDVSTTTNPLGVFTWPDANADVTATAVGPLVRVINAAGAAATSMFNVADAGSFVWNDSATEFVDAQLSAFVHASLVKEYVRPWNPGLAWLDQQLSVTVNINENCNAYSDGDAIYFMREGGGCSNIGRLADIVYHEFGHSLHFQSIIPGVGAFDSSMGEGVGDFLAATIVNDSAVGPGYYLGNEPLREIDPIDLEYIYPNDLGASIHANGLIYSGTFWDLRKALIASLGAEQGIATTERFFYATLQRAADMSSAYVEVLVEDDDDGDLTNGTPNLCDIETAFAAHGLALESVSFGLVQHEVLGLDVRVPVMDELPGCLPSIAGIELIWRSRTNPTTQGAVTMVIADGAYNAEIPYSVAGDVVQYQLRLQGSDASEHTLPNNAADPWYETFIGTPTSIYCTNFETDPAQDGWTHTQTDGTAGRDDWEWGVPAGSFGRHDPLAAYTGTQVFGNDLTGNQRYPRSMTNEASSPAVDVSGHEVVRLQYRRWLGVEDGLFDSARVYANGALVWSNFASTQGGSGDVHHLDREWRFHDIDLTDQVDAGMVQLRFELSSDGGLEFGGWTLDDLCIVGARAADFTPIFESGFEAE